MKKFNGIIYNDGQGDNQYIFSIAKEVDTDSLVKEFNFKLSESTNEKKLLMLHLESTDKKPKFMEVIQKMYIDMDTINGINNIFNTQNENL